VALGKRCDASENYSLDGIGDRGVGFGGADETVKDRCNGSGEESCLSVGMARLLQPLFVINLDLDEQTEYILSADASTTDQRQPKRMTERTFV
jgi:hypothetical protein